MSTWDKWAERIYSESDFGRGVATSIAGAIGLAVYLFTADWVVAAFVTIIVFPVVRILASALQRKAENAATRRKHELEVRGSYERLSDEERAVVAAFVAEGGSVITWDRINKLNLPHSAVESLVQRELLFTSVTADGMRETFVLDEQLFGVGLEHSDART